MASSSRAHDHHAPGVSGAAHLLRPQRILGAHRGGACAAPLSCGTRLAAASIKSAGAIGGAASRVPAARRWLARLHHRSASASSLSSRSSKASVSVPLAKWRVNRNGWLAGAYRSASGGGASRERHTRSIAASARHARQHPAHRRLVARRRGATSSRAYGGAGVFRGEGGGSRALKHQTSAW